MELQNIKNPLWDDFLQEGDIQIVVSSFFPLSCFSPRVSTWHSSASELRLNMCNVTGCGAHSLMPSAAAVCESAVSISFRVTQAEGQRAT